MTSTPKPRAGGRATDELRPVVIRPDFNKHAEGSVLIEMGDTRVICTASIEDKVPPFLMRSGKGWVTAEYGMLPRATNERNAREAAKGKQGGRTLEIQRLIGRALRGTIDQEALGERTVIIDCDVIQADGGTRCASITGGYVALVLALGKIYLGKKMVNWPVRSQVAAVSVGIRHRVPHLDLDYSEDSTAEVDMNIVATDAMQFIELQGTAEKGSFSEDEMTSMIALAKGGIEQLVAKQREILSPLLAQIDETALERLKSKFKK